MSSVIPLQKSDKASGTRAEEDQSFTPQQLRDLKIIQASDEGSRQLKVFRDLRTRLMKQAGGGNFVCLVTSAASGGSSYVASNLAATISLDRSKIATLVDCNLYSPTAQRLLRSPPLTGLTDYLDDTALSVDEVTYVSGVPRMRVVPVGNNKEGGTEKLNSGRMRKFFVDAKNSHPNSYTIIDSPSSAEFDAEIRILADLCDFVVLVVPYGKVTPAQLRAAVDKIGRDRLAGVVYNES